MTLTELKLLKYANCPVAKDAEVEKMFHEQKDAIDYENQVGHAGWFDCFRRENKTLYRTILGMTLQAGQQLTGANYFFYVSLAFLQFV